MRLTCLVFITVLLNHPAVDAYAKRIREALRLSDLSLEKACLYMDLSKSHFSAQLSGVGHISASRLAKLPEEFQRWYHALGVMDYGLPARLEQASPVVKMAKAGLVQSDDEMERT
jgi:hypothetical protein